MKLQVLGCYGGDHQARFPAFLIEDFLLLDAGTIGAALSLENQLKITTVLISHHHIDHLLALPFFADTIYAHHNHPIYLHALPEVLGHIKTHLFNNIIWPDFTQLPTPDSPTLSYAPIEIGKSFRVQESLQITPLPSCHTCPASGFLIEKDGQVLIYTGDTGPCDPLWESLQNRLTNPRTVSLVIECSFPNRLQHFALETGHLTPALLKQELAKTNLKEAMIYVFHMKPQHFEEIKAEIREISDYSIKLMAPDDEYILGHP